jgi:D-alanyl-D-alanine carboxypeptidase (penicillin-binding protein 5/6)
LRLFVAIACACASVGLRADPLITASSAIVMDAESGRVLFSRSPDARRFPASTTKILTALLLVEHCDPLTEIRAPLSVEEIEGSSLHLEPAERVRAEDLLYSLLLRSANDAAYAVAVHIAGSQEAFAAMMNERAKQLGCTGSNFTNPHGLHDPQHYTTARDLALIAREALRNERFREAARTARRTIWRSTNLEDTVLINKNRLLAADPDAIGVKTGYTSAAGHCFVGARSRDGWTAIVVVLNSADWLADTLALLDWAFTEYYPTTIVSRGEAIGSAQVSGGDRPSLPAVAAANLRVPLSMPERVAETHVRFDALSAPVQEGQRIGELRLTLTSGDTFQIPLIAAKAVPVGSTPAPSSQWLLASLGIAIVAAGLILLARARNG